MAIRFIEVCFTPSLYNFRHTRENFIVVVVDILRAGTSMCAAFMNGIEKIYPLSDLDEAKKLKAKGYLLAGERDGLKIDFADFGNSPFEFENNQLSGKSLAYSTTNGTRTIEMAKSADMLVIGAFTNLKYLADWLTRQDKNILILCAGWKDTFSLEDAVFAGALVKKLTQQKDFGIAGDAVFAALKLWETAENNLLEFIQFGSHCERLKKIGAGDDIAYAIRMDTTPVVPVLKDEHLINIIKK
jgi:2-phosphosulfolactate phosphatase